MQKSCDFVKQHGLEFSRSIDELLIDPVKYGKEINQIQEWLKNHFQKIAVSLNKDHIAVIQSLADHIQRKDSLIICDASFTIHNYSGTQNFFSGLEIEYGNTLNLLDLVEENDQHKLKAALEQAVSQKQDVQLPLRLKTNSEILSQCSLHIDMAASNPANDRYVVGLKFGQMLASQLLEYQSLILDALPGVDIYLLDQNYSYLFSGGKEKERFSYSNTEMIGKTIFEVLDKKAARLIYPYIRKALKGTVNEGEIRYKKEVYYLKATPVKNFKNETVAAILFSQNISDEKRVEQQLKNGREQALKADKLKSIFIANLSHEIRTPLNAIIGFSEQMDKTALTKEQLKYNSMIKKASDHLLYLVTEIVFLFKLGMGKVFIEKTPFSLSDLLSDLYEIFEHEAREKGIELTFNIADDFPEGVVGDSYRVRQILSNLLSNAIKYTDKGTVTLEGRLRREYKKKVQLEFCVSDTGVGISRKYLNKIFDVFEQGSKFNTAFRSGAGLGLGICKRLTELLNGKISVKSELHEGSKFTVILPFPKIKSPDEIPQKEKQFALEDNKHLLAGKKILLADDDEHNLILSGNILERWKTDYTLVDSGDKAIDLLQKTKFDLIIVDIHMPGKNGLDVARFLHSSSNLNQETPLFFITANAFQSDIHNYLKEGFDGYLIKPFREADFYSKLCNILQIEHPENQLAEVKPKTQQALADKLQTRELLNTAGDDRNFYENMLNRFITNATHLKQLLENAKDEQNWKEVGEKTHKGITSFRYFGLMETAALLEKIEDHTVRKLHIEKAEPLVVQAAQRIDVIITELKAELIR